MSVKDFISDNGVDLVSSGSIPEDTPDEEIIYDWSGEVFTYGKTE